MAEVKASMTWKGGLKFEGVSAFGNKVAIDAAKGAGGGEDGVKPTELLLWGIAGCTGIDVIRILRKQRQEIDSLEIEVVGRQNDDYPKPFHTIEVKYHVVGRNVDPDKLAKAIELSEGKYCVVSQTVQRETTITTSFEIETSGAS
ncbi:MAG: OsmC family protein [Vicinamibacteria bacterium]|nr:OsmC family protein [Vicinamibacteria bacterium]